MSNDARETGDLVGSGEYPPKLRDFRHTKIVIDMTLKHFVSIAFRAQTYLMTLQIEQATTNDFTG